MPGAIAVWDYGLWSGMFPEFDATVTAPQALGFWNRATILLANDGSSPFRDVTKQQTLLFLAAAHIAKLSIPAGPGGTGGFLNAPVGRISSVGGAGLNVATQNDYPPGSPQWWQQTHYGSEFWEATKLARMGRFIPGPQRIFDPWPSTPY